MNVVNGSSSIIAVGEQVLMPGGAARNVPPATTDVLTAAGVKVPLRGVSAQIAQGRPWVTAASNAGAFFSVHASDGAPTVLFTNAVVAGDSAGPYVWDDKGLTYMNPAPGATVPAGFRSSRPVPQYAAAGVSGAPCDTGLPMELYSLQRLLNAPQLAAAQGDLPPLRFVSSSASAPSSHLTFVNAAATARAPGFASRSCVGPLLTPLADWAKSTGTTIIAAPPRPEDVLVAVSTAGERAKELPTHIRATAPVTLGQATFNLMPISESAKCREENIRRTNYMLDRYADLQLAAMASPKFVL